MRNLSTTAARGEAIKKRLRDEEREVRPEKSEYRVNGERVDIVHVYSRSGKRIALVEDEGGEQFEVFYEMLE